LNYTNSTKNWRWTQLICCASICSAIITSFWFFFGYSWRKMTLNGHVMGTCRKFDMYVCLELILQVIICILKGWELGKKLIWSKVSISDTILCNVIYKVLDSEYVSTCFYFYNAHLFVSKIIIKKMGAPLNGYGKSLRSLWLENKNYILVVPMYYVHVCSSSFYILMNLSFEESVLVGVKRWSKCFIYLY
jgi:hypothetical protein